MIENKLGYYESLLTLSYDDLVNKLLDQYGGATKNYFKEQSYKNYLKGKSRNVNRGKISRTSEGLYCHHIDEKLVPSLSYAPQVKARNLPYRYQKKERLVYCDLIEHAILHALISTENSYSLGYCSLCGIIRSWYIDEILPNNGNKWELKGYYKSFLKPKEAEKLLELMDKKYVLNHNPHQKTT